MKMLNFVLENFDHGHETDSILTDEAKIMSCDCPGHYLIGFPTNENGGCFDFNDDCGLCWNRELRVYHETE